MVRLRLAAVAQSSVLLLCGCGASSDLEGSVAGATLMGPGGLPAANGALLEVTTHFCAGADRTPVTAFAYNRNVLLQRGVPAVDSDGDGISDALESAPDSRTSPWIADTDHDGLGDAVELLLGRDPGGFDDAAALCPRALNGRYADADGDLLNRCEEEAIGTDFSRIDSDGDGLPDGLELYAQLGPLNDRDPDLDSDADGLDNFAEIVAHTHPLEIDVADSLAHAYHHQTQGQDSGPCIDVRISNVRLMPTGEVDGEVGVNHILIVLIEAPRTGPPELFTRMVTAPVRFVCGETGRPERCRSSVPDGRLHLDL